MLVGPLAGRTVGGPDASFVIGEWVDEGGGDQGDLPRLIAPLHLHHGDDEAWYVTSGALRFRLGDEEVEARAGAAVFVPGLRTRSGTPAPNRRAT